MLTTDEWNDNSHLKSIEEMAETFSLKVNPIVAKVHCDVAERILIGVGLDGPVWIYKPSWFYLLDNKSTKH